MILDIGFKIQDISRLRGVLDTGLSSLKVDNIMQLFIVGPLLAFPSLVATGVCWRLPGGWRRMQEVGNTS